MDTSTQLLRVDLDGRWSAQELGDSLISLSDLYDLRLYLELIREDFRDWEHFYHELMHFPPFRMRWKRRLSAFGPFPWGAQAPGALPVLDDALLTRLSLLLDPQERLEVRRIQYSSPGFTDLAGIGTVIGHIKDFVLKLVERRDGRRQRDLNEERTSLENDRLRLENARSFVSLAKELGYSETELRVLVRYVDDKQESIMRLVDQQKIRNVSTPDNASGE